MLLAAASCGRGEHPPGSGRPSLPIPLTWETIFNPSAGVRQAALSPDGTLVAVAALGAEGNGIYLVQIAVANESQAPATRFLGEGASPVWAPDSASLLFTRDNDLWLVRRDGGQATRVTSDPGDERWAAFSPDGRTIAFQSSRGGAQDVWLVATEGGAPRQLTQGAMAVDDGRFGPAWSPDGHSIAYVSNAAEYWHDDLWVFDVATGQGRQVSRTLMASSVPAWSPDGQAIALLGTSKDEYWYEDLAYIFVVDPATGVERTVDMQVYATDWLHSLPVLWSRDGSWLYFERLERGELDLWSVPASGGVATRVSHLGGAVRSFDTDRASDAFIVVRTTPTRGPDVEWLPASGGPPRRLTTFAATFDGVHDVEEVSYRSFDGLYIQGFLYRPPEVVPGRRYPALVNVHGGGTNSYLRGQNLIEQYLASRGYFVLAINYRGGSGFGRAFQDLSVNDWANGQAHDAAAAADFLRAQSWSNGKVGIYGYSYGGITTMAAIARWPEAFDAAVPMAGIYDFADAYTNADRVGKIFIRTGHGGSPEERPDVYAVTNTLSRLDRVKTPLLVMHGEADVRAPYKQYLLAVERLAKSGKIFEQKSYPDEPHGFRNPADRVDMYQRLEQFFESRLR